MGENAQEWEDLHAALRAGGADLIECNFSCPHMSGHGLSCDIGAGSGARKTLYRAVRRGTELPILAKMTPNVGNMEPVAIAAVEGGASGIAAINTIKSISDLDLSTPAAVCARHVTVSGYSGKAVKPIALRFIYEMASYPGLSGVPLSGMGGIETWKDAAEFLALGCTNVRVTTAVMEYGYSIISRLIAAFPPTSLRAVTKSLSAFCGKGLSHMASPDTLDRETICYPALTRKNVSAAGAATFPAGMAAIRPFRSTKSFACRAWLEKVRQLSALPARLPDRGELNGAREKVRGKRCYIIRKLVHGTDAVKTSCRREQLRNEAARWARRHERPRALDSHGRGH